MGYKTGSGLTQVPEAQPTFNVNPLTGEPEALSVGDVVIDTELLATSQLQTDLNLLITEGLGAPDDAAYAGSGNANALQLLRSVADAALNEDPAVVTVLPAEYEVIEASDTDEIVGSTGAIGDKLEALLVIPTATTVGAISIEDGSTNIVVYAGGTLGADLKPFVIPLLGIRATTATGWEITTGVGCRVIAFGDGT